jgi:hypothetical protein
MGDEIPQSHELFRSGIAYSMIGGDEPPVDEFAGGKKLRRKSKKSMKKARKSKKKAMRKSRKNTRKYKRKQRGGNCGCMAN